MNTSNHIHKLSEAYNQCLPRRHKIITALLIATCFAITSTAYADRDDDEDKIDTGGVCNTFKLPKSAHKHNNLRDMCIDFCVQEKCQSLSTSDKDYKNDVRRCDKLADKFLAKAGFPIPCIQKPSLSVQKLTDGLVEGTTPIKLNVGDPVNWTYNITNNGNTNLTVNTVVDTGSDLKPISVSCNPALPAPLAAGLSMSCNATGTVIPGNYTNKVSVTALDSNSQQVSGSDSGAYDGLTSGIKITIEPSTAMVTVGQTYQWNVTVSNTGTFDLTGITYPTNTAGVSGCPLALSAGSSGNCSSAPIIATDPGTINASIMGQGIYTNGLNVSSNVTDSASGSISVAPVANIFSTFFGTGIPVTTLFPGATSSCIASLAGTYQYQVFNTCGTAVCGCRLSSVPLNATSPSTNLLIEVPVVGVNNPVSIYVLNGACATISSPAALSSAVSTDLIPWCVPGTSFTLLPQ